MWKINLDTKKRDSLILLIFWLTYVCSVFFAVRIVSYILAPVICFISAVILFLAMKKMDGKARFIFLFVGLSCVLWGFTDIARVFFIATGRLTPEFFLALTILNSFTNFVLLIPIIKLTLFKRSFLSSIQFVLDIGIISVLLFIVVFYVILGRSFDRIFVLSGPNGSVLLVRSIINMLILSFTFSLLLMVDRKKITPSMVFFAFGCIFFIVADFYYMVLCFQTANATDGVYSVLYMLAVVFFGLSGAYIRTIPVVWSDRLRGTDSVMDTVYRSIFLIFLSLVSVLSFRLQLNSILFIVGAVLLYQALSIMIRQLRQKEISLHEKAVQNVDLEARIDERTRELRVMNQTLENLIVRDAITGLYNRKYFLEQIEGWIPPVSADERIWLMIIDFNRFKSINDTYGHDVGDKVLRLVGKRLETIMNDRTIVARLGGDEFGIACLRSQKEIVDTTLRSVTDLCDMPIVIGSFTVHITVSIGVSVWPDDAKTRSDLMRHADIAMYIAKNRREGGVSFFDHSLNERVERANKIDLALRKVDYDGEFELNFQPQITVGGQRLVGAEALVRWSSPELGIVCPDEFIPVAEENGTIIAMSDWIMKHAFLRIADWNRRYNKELLMGVNISPIQMDASDFLMKLESLLDETKALPDWINLEMTERSAMKDATFIIEIFNRLAELNITTSIDDFGTGYSSLSYLKKFNIDYLKIAKELVDGIAESDTDRDIVQAIIMMSTALGLHTIAEGVEDENQLRLLTSLGCDEIQGYYFGKPVSSDEFEELYLKE